MREIAVEQNCQQANVECFFCFGSSPSRMANNHLQERYQAWQSALKFKLQILWLSHYSWPNHTHFIVISFHVEITIPLSTKAEESLKHSWALMKVLQFSETSDVQT